MWYFNDKYIHEAGYNLMEAVVLQLAHQNRTEDKEDSLSMYLSDSILEKFFKEDLIKMINKKRKSDSDFSVIRITKKGTTLLETFGTPDITKGDEQMFEYLCQMYLKSEDSERVIGNKKKTKQYCAIFRQKMSLTLHEMYWLCFLFLEDYKFTKKLENIFFDSNKHRYGSFSAHFEDGSLYQYLDENREKIEKFWSKKITEH